MSISMDAKLVYGYDFGDPHSMYASLGEKSGISGPLTRDGNIDFNALEWYDPYDPREGSNEQAMNFLLKKLMGFDHKETISRAYWSQRREAEAQLGVHFGTYGNDSYSRTFLATYEVTAYKGEICVIDPIEMTRMPIDGHWDALLNRAIETLGLTMIQPSPRWFICSFMG
jgi:hypothetical protein